MAEEPEDFFYTGLHAFVFVEHLDAGARPQEIVARLRRLGTPAEGGPTIFAATFVGDYSVFAHVRVDGSLAELQDLLEGELWDAGVHTKTAIETGVYSMGTDMLGAKRMTPEVIALSAIRVLPGELDNVLQRLGQLPNFKGASIVFGSFDILLQLGGETFEEVSRTARDELQKVEGIARTSTAFTDGTR